MSRADTVGLLLAGGLARRMGGGDKPLKELGGRPLLEHVVERARPQVGQLLLNVNGDASRFALFGLPVVADVVGGFAGPLAGILTGLEWLAENAPDARWLASFATDAPFFPRDMVDRLADAAESGNARIACACSCGRTHPVFAIWAADLAADLRSALVGEDVRKIDRWTARYSVAEVVFEADDNGRDPFFNINRPEDLAAAESVL
ncbi:MAG: molybdenum cofactor guanylyltransferase MobA [Rhodospirillales bacterium]